MKPSTHPESAHETSFHGDEFLATYVQLVEKLGPPTELGSGDGKVRYNWIMETEEGEVFTVYDWKEPFFDFGQEIYWHIGAHSSDISRKAYKEIEKAFLRKMKNFYIYLDDVRTPKDSEWIVVRDYDQFVAKVQEVGLQNIHTISLDHDLGDSATKEYYRNVQKNYTLDYANITEKTGYDCAKWLVDHFLDSDNKWNMLLPRGKEQSRIPFPNVTTHSANPIGASNIMGYINNFLMNERQPQTCVRVQIPHTTN